MWRPRSECFVGALSVCCQLAGMMRAASRLAGVKHAGRVTASMGSPSHSCSERKCSGTLSVPHTSCSASYQQHHHPCTISTFIFILHCVHAGTSCGSASPTASGSRSWPRRGRWSRTARSCTPRRAWTCATCCTSSRYLMGGACLAATCPLYTCGPSSKWGGAGVSVCHLSPPAPHVYSPPDSLVPSPA